MTSTERSTTAANIDFTDFLARRTFAFFGAVLALSFVLLMIVFRSLLVPLKAVIMNVLSITATYGVLVAVFQWGWGADLIDIDGGPVEALAPLMLFAVVFGLSMELLGDRNWWLPTWLERIIPRLSVEHPTSAAVAPQPEPELVDA